MGWWAFLVSVCASAALLERWQPGIFQRFLGIIDPLWVFVTGSLVATICLLVLAGKGVPARESSGKAAETWWWAAAAAGLATIPIITDLIDPFPPAINIAFPYSVLFYPVIGFVAETAFHLLPLTLIALALRQQFSRLAGTRWSPLYLVVLVEPVYQAVFLSAAPLWVIGATFVNLVLFNLLQVQAFLRRGFFAMYLLRIVYYLVWHIGWGWLRLHWL